MLQELWRDSAVFTVGPPKVQQQQNLGMDISLKGTEQLSFSARVHRSASAEADSPRTCCRLPDSQPGAGVVRAGACRPCAAHLPTEVLRQIFGYLPFSCQARCALVCRRWYASLPDSRWQMARWIQEHPRIGWNRDSDFLWLAYSARVRPFLAACQSPLLPVLDAGYQVLACHPDSLGSAGVQQEPMRAQGQLHRQQRHFCALAQYSLYQQWRASESLRLRPSAMDWTFTGSTEDARFSHCGRWLAISWQHADSDFATLHLYGWQDNRWHRQALLPPPEDIVNDFAFSPHVADTLVSAHGSCLIRWERGRDGDWQRRQVCQINRSCYIYFIQLTAGGDLLALTSDRRTETTLQLLFFQHQGADRGWGPPLSCFYHRIPRFSVFVARPGALALTVTDPALGAAYPTNAVHIWYKTSDGAQSPVWRCQVSPLSAGRAPVRSLLAAPDWRHMLGLLEDQRILLWALDAHYGLQELLSCRSAINPDSDQFGALASFGKEGTQLAVYCPDRRIALWNLDAQGSSWQGDRLQIVPESDDDSDRLRRLVLSADGRTLMYRTRRQVFLCHLEDAGHWQKRLLYTRAPGQTVEPFLFSCQSGTRLFYTMAPQGGALWLRGLHGLDGQGQCVIKGCASPPVKPDFFLVSPDGLSLLCYGNEGAPCVLQLAPDRACLVGESGDEQELQDR